MTSVTLHFIDPYVETDRARIMLEMAEGQGLIDVRFEKTPMGKPHLISATGESFGYSNSYARLEDRMAGLFAISTAFPLGVDLELWPRREADVDFLATVASPEDESVIALLARSGHDAGTALWVIKESALKCTGEVFIDPRWLAVSKLENGMFLVSTSRNARMPHLEIEVSLQGLESANANGDVFLVGLAFPFFKAPNRSDLIFGNNARLIPILSQLSDN